MKKLIAMLLLLSIAVVPLSACGGNETNFNTTEQTETQEPSKTEDPAVDGADYRQAVLQSFSSLTEAPASDFVYEIGEKGATVLSYTGSAEAVRVPSTLGICKVVAIGDGAFADNQTLKVLSLPDTVTEIGEGILRGCTSLEALETPLISANAESEQFLGYLFGYTSYADNIKVPASLAYVKLGGSISAVSAFAFADCNRLVAVVLGDEVTSVGDFAFYYCERLKYVNMDELTAIGSYAFASCNVLVRAELGASLASVGLGAFQGCAALSSMTLPFVGGSKTENTYLGYLFGAQEPDFTAGYIPAYLRMVTLLDTCTELGNYAFFECSSLRTVTLSQTLTSIGVRAFEGCEKLEKLTLPNTLTNIRENAFFGCTALEEVTFGNGLVSMGINAFYRCTALKAIALPASLTLLPASAFADCTALERVDLGGVTKVGKNAFYHCNAIKNVQAAAEIEFEDGNDAVEQLLEK